MVLKTIQERRKVPRIDFQGRVEINLSAPGVARQARPLHPQVHVEANSVNLTEAGMCVRLQEALEVRSPVKLRLFTEPHKRPLECAGRVAWVVQRLDLRDTPPFLYDIGVEFIDPPTRLRQFSARIGIALKPKSLRATTSTLLQPAMINGRCYVPRVERQTSPSPCWHLVVWVEGVPCFSQRFSTEREAIASWEQFKRKALLPATRSARPHTNLPRPNE